jgi:hypothetical protein
MKSRTVAAARRWEGVVRALAGTRVRVEIALWRHGWLWLAAALLLGACAAMTVFARLSLAQEHELLSQQTEGLASLRKAADERSGPADGSQAVKDMSDADSQAALAAVLLPADEVGNELRRIYKIAAEQQVSIAQADFQEEPAVGGSRRLQMAFPTKATYPQLRRFLETSLREFPNLSLDRLAFKRNQVGEAQVEAKVHVSLWLGPNQTVRADTASLQPLRKGQP